MKTIKIVILVFVLVFILSNNVFAIDEIWNIGGNWTELGGKHVGVTMDTSVLIDTSNSLYNILLVAAICVAMIVGAILGIIYMTAGISKKAEVKESLFPYLISCIIVFGSFGIWKLAVVTINSFQPK